MTEKPGVRRRDIHSPLWKLLEPAPKRDQPTESDERVSGGPSSGEGQ